VIVRPRDENRGRRAESTISVILAAARAIRVIATGQRTSSIFLLTPMFFV
jgi:hypothetical protein